MRSEDFDYHLPDHAVAQRPVEPRDAARLLVDRGPGVAAEHRRVAELDGLLRPGDVVVVNDTRVLPARLAVRKTTGGAAEVFLLECEAGATWRALIRPGRRVPPGTSLFTAGGLEIVAGTVLEDGVRQVTICADDPDAAIVAHGEVPLPPYITAALHDHERYQTVYARRSRSVAAPTAGLHLTDAVLGRIRERGIPVLTVELWVGLGTFRPITVEDIEDHRMHAEYYEVPPSTWTACQAAERVVAIGTTTVRALESAAATGELQGRTELFLRPGSPIHVVDVLLTNFHLPRSSLLVMIEAFAGPHWRDLYAEALAAGYRFLSFGDAMLLERRP